MGAPRVAGLDAASVTDLLSHALSSRPVMAEQVLQLRRAADVQAAVLAAGRRSAAQAWHPLSTVEAMRACGPGSDAFAQRDLTFHAALAGATGNPLHAPLVERLRGLMKDSVGQGLRYDPDATQFGTLVGARAPGLSGARRARGRCGGRYAGTPPSGGKSP